jgi:outer membrane protein assembly factor BamB
MLRGFDHHNHLIGKAKDEGFNEDQRETLRNREQKKVAERLKGKAALFTMTTPKDCYLFERDSPGVLGGGFLWVGLTRQKVSGSVGIFCVNLESGKKESVREINMEALNHLFMSADQRQLFIIGHPGAEGTPGWENTFKIVCLGTKDKTNHWETCFPVDQHIVGAAAGDKGVLILLSKRKTDGWNTKHLSGDLVCLNPLTGAKQWDLPLAQKCGGLFGGGFASGLVADEDRIFFADSTKIYSASWEGKIHWSTPLPDAILERADNNSNTAVESLCLTGDGRLIVSAFGVLTCFETKQGRLAWIATDHDARTGPVVGPDGTGYLSTFGILKAINLQDGKLKWSADFSEDQDVLVGGCRPPVITKDGKVYFQTNVCLRSVDAQTGSLHWRITLTNYGTHCSPLVDDQGRILVWVQDPPGIFCLNVKCGGLDGPWPRLGCDAQNTNVLES